MSTYDFTPTLSNIYYLSEWHWINKLRDRLIYQCVYVNDREDSFVSCLYLYQNKFSYRKLGKEVCYHNNTKTVSGHKIN